MVFFPVPPRDTCRTTGWYMPYHWVVHHVLLGGTSVPLGGTCPVPLGGTLLHLPCGSVPYSPCVPNKASMSSAHGALSFQRAAWLKPP